MVQCCNQKSGFFYNLPINQLSYIGQACINFSNVYIPVLMQTDPQTPTVEHRRKNVNGDIQWWSRTDKGHYQTMHNPEKTRFSNLSYSLLHKRTLAHSLVFQEKGK